MTKDRKREIIRGNRFGEGAESRESRGVLGCSESADGSWGAHGRWGESEGPKRSSLSTALLIPIIYSIQTLVKNSSFGKTL